MTGQSTKPENPRPHPFWRSVKRGLYGLFGFAALAAFLLFAPVVPFTPYCDDPRFNRETREYDDYWPVGGEIDERYTFSLKQFLIYRGYYGTIINNTLFIPSLYYVSLFHVPPIYRHEIRSILYDPIDHYEMTNYLISLSSIYYIATNGFDPNRDGEMDMSRFGGPPDSEAYDDCKYMRLVTRPGALDGVEIPEAR